MLANQGNNHSTLFCSSQTTSNNGPVLAPPFKKDTEKQKQIQRRTTMRSDLETMCYVERPRELDSLEKKYILEEI